MKAPLSRLAYVMVFLTVTGYAFFTLRGPKGIPGLLGQTAPDPGIGKARHRVAREIEQKREHIKRLTGNPAEQEMEIRHRLKLVHPGEKIYILGEPEKK